MKLQANTFLMAAWCWSAAMSQAAPANAAITFKANWPGFTAGPGLDVKVEGTLAYLAIGDGGLLILDVTDPGAPRKVGAFNTLGFAQSLDLAGDYAFIADGWAGITIVDIRNPANPILAGLYAGTTNVSRLVARGDRLYVADRSSGFQILDVTTPADARVLGTLPGQPVYVVVRGDHAFLLDNGLRIVSLANEANPVQLSRLNDGFGKAMSIDENYAYIVNAGGALRPVDVRNLSLPAVISTIQFETYRTSFITLNGRFAYISHEGYPFVGYSDRVEEVDLGDLSNPTVLRQWSGGEAGSVVADGLLYTVGKSGLNICSLQGQADDLKPLSRFYTSATPFNLVVQGNYAYLANGAIGLQILDLSNPINPALLSTKGLKRPVYNVAVLGRYVYLENTAIIDASDPRNPVIVRDSSFDGTVTVNLKIFGQRRYSASHHFDDVIGDDEANFRANFATHWGFTTLRDKLESGVGYSELADFPDTFSSEFSASGGHGFVFRDGGLAVFNELAPSNRVTFPTAVGGRHIAATEGFVVVSGTGLQIFDSSSPTNLIPRGRFGSAGGPTNDFADLICQGNWIVAVETNRGLHIVDFGNPDDPRQIAEYRGVGFNKLALAGNYAIVAHGVHGATILDLGLSAVGLPVVTFQPQNERGLPGSTVRFDVGVRGTVPISYQWVRNGTNYLAGATNFVLSLTNLQLSQAGAYSCIISNSVGVATSSNAVLTVDHPPSISLSSPGENEVFLAPASVPLAVSPSDEDGTVAKVEYFSGSTLLLEATNAPFNRTWSAVPMGSYVIKARATDNEGAQTEAEPVSITVTNVPVLQLSKANYRVNESNGAVTITVRRNSSEGVATVDLRTSDGTAHEVAPGRIGNYFGTNTVLHFASGQSSQSVSVGLVNDLVYRGESDFVVQLSNAQPAAIWRLAYPTTAHAIITDDDSPTNNIFIDVVGPTNVLVGGAVEVRLGPEEVYGRWRFWWEREWRPSGSSASNLVAGTYEIEFMPHTGFMTLSNAVVTITNTESVTITRSYVRSESTPLGGVRMRLNPSTVAEATNELARGQWRVVGGGDGSWQDSGAVVSNLASGMHYVEFKSVTGGYETPAGHLVVVLAGQNLTYEASYAAAPVTVANGPRPVDSYNTITNDFLPGAPYKFTGQLISEAGYASGVAVRKRAVLTAGHVVFDATRLSYLSNVLWFLQRHRGEHEPAGQLARGSFVFSGYAAERTNDYFLRNLPPDQSSIESRNLDVAALFFFEDAGRKGFSGFLTTDDDHQWLVSSRLKMLVGYPVDNIPEADRGKMHYAGAFFGAFEKVTNQVYQTDLIRSYGGNSGGPVCVLSTNSLGEAYFIPAGVYLGESASEAIARAIDVDVVDLINRAEASGFGGTNSSSGGVILIRSPLAQLLSKPAYLTVSVGPPAAVRLGGGWRISPTNSGEVGELHNYTNRFRGETVEFSVYSTNFSVEIQGLSGFTNRPVEPLELTEGADKLLEVRYEVDAPRLLHYRTNQNRLVLGLSGREGTRYRIESGPTLPLSDSNVSATILNLTAGTNWMPPVAIEAGNRFYRAVWISD